MTATLAGVEADLRAAFGEQVLRAPDGSALFVALGPIGVRVEVADVGGGDAAIEAYAWIGQDLEITPELGLDLARRNAGLRFGALSVDDEDAIILGHALFGDAAGATAVVRLVRVLAETAEALDAELRA